MLPFDSDLNEARVKTWTMSIEFEASFDFIDHQLHVQTSEGALRALALAPRSAADFYIAVPCEYPVAK